MDIGLGRNIKGKYRLLDEKKLHGVHYTPNALAGFVADRIISNYTFGKKREISIFDPAVGDGNLLYALVKRLLQKKLAIKVFGYDIDKNALDIASRTLQSLQGNIETFFSLQDFASQNDSKKCTFDLVIANPPYVRTQSLGMRQSTNLSRRYGLEGRIDLYYIFLLGISRFMHPKSVAGFIVSNRFMTTKSGASVRKGLIDNYGLYEVYDLGDTRLFEAAVLPAVLVFGKQKKAKVTKFVSVYSKKTHGIENIRENGLFEAISEPEGLFRDNGSIYEIKNGFLKMEEDRRSVWSISNRNTDIWLETVKKHTLCTFRDLGKIRVGVKTTADKVFIQKNWDETEGGLCPEKEVLKPLITHHFADRFKQKEGNPRQILYTHKSENGKKTVVNFTRYPKAWNYLLSHRRKLSSREYLSSSGRNWYEIWVPQEPSLWSKPKIVFRDICKTPTFWLDLSGSVVNGDCYWFVLNENMDEENIWMVLAVANSSFVESFYDHKFNNRLYAGRRRFMTQYVDHFPVPKAPKKHKKKIVDLAKQIYRTKPNATGILESDLNRLVWKAFGFASMN